MRDAAEEYLREIDERVERASAKGTTAYFDGPCNLEGPWEEEQED